MTHHIRFPHLVLALSFAVVSTHASAQDSPVQSQVVPPPSVLGNTIDRSDPSAQVVAVSDTTNATGNQVTIRSVQAPAAPDVPKPSFDALDTNHDGIISESEAGAYVPLINDYLHLARKGTGGVTRTEYERWH